MQILLTGGTGFIGSELCKKLIASKHKLTILTRKSLQNNDKIIYINDLDQKEFLYDVVINIAGEPISKYWTLQSKKKIYDSRINLTKKLVKKINESTNKPSLFISGSAIGYYGISSRLKFNEDSKTAYNVNLFSQKICQDWERQAELVNKKVRLVKIRTGIVLGKSGGALKKMITPFKLGLGGKIGSASQYMSWIDIKDAVEAIIFIINNEKICGAVNLTSPNCVTNSEFTTILAKILNRPCFFNMPEFVVKILFGQMGQELLLSGQRVYPQTLLESGFEFKYGKLEQSLSSILI